MQGLENIIAYIKSESDAECGAIAKEAIEECDRIRDDYARSEQDEYWKYLSAGAKDTEHRLEQLNNLAAQEAKKLIVSTQQKMIDAAFELAAQKLSELPEHELNELRARLGVEADCGADALVGRYKDELAPDVAAILFDSNL